MTRGGGIVCAVLAAGASARLGRPKPLLEWRGQPLVVRAVRAAAAVGRAGVVLGAAREDVERVLDSAEVGPRLRVDVLPNDAWSEGIASSVRVAARWARALRADALVLHLVDQPFVDAGHLERLVGAYHTGVPLVGTGYAGVVGAPALFSRPLFGALDRLEGDRGAAAILRAHAETRAVAAPEAAVDVDTPEDAAYLLAPSSPKATRR